MSTIETAARRLGSYPAVAVVPLFGGCVATALMISLAPSSVIPFALFLLAGAFAFAFRWPVAALCLSFAFVPLELFALPLADAALTPAEGMLLLTAAAWLTRKVVHGDLSLERSPAGKPLALLVAAIVPGFLVAVDPYDVVKTTVIWTALLVVYQLVLTEASPAALRRLVFVIIASATTVGVVAAVQSGAGSHQELSTFGAVAYGRAVGPFSDPNTLAAYLLMALPFALLYVARRRPTVRVAGLVGSAAILAGIVFSLSRTAILAVVVVAATMCVWRRFRRVAASITAGVAFVLVASFLIAGMRLTTVPQADLLRARVQSIQSDRGGMRLETWKASPAMFRDHPWLGVGAGQFRYAAPDYGLIDPKTGSPIVHAHNNLLNLAVERGIIGAAAYIWLLWALLRLAVASRDIQTGRGIRTAVWASIVAFLAMGLVNVPLQNNILVGFFFVLCAAVTTLARPAADQVESSTAKERQA